MVNLLTYEVNHFSIIWEKNDKRANELMITKGSIVYITKYALTSGILQQEVISLGISNSDYIHTITKELFELNKDCFETYEAAVTQAKILRTKKIKSLETKIKKLNELKFS